MIGSFQMFWVNFGFPQDGHEVGVPGPSGNDVAMNMFVITSPGYFAKIIANVKTIGIDHRAQYLDALADQLVHLRAFVGILFS